MYKTFAEEYRLSECIETKRAEIIIISTRSRVLVRLDKIQLPSLLDLFLV